MRPTRLYRWAIILLMIALLALLSCEKFEQASPTGVDAMLQNQAAMKRSLPAYLSSPPDIIVNTTADAVDFSGAQQVGDLPGPDGLVSLREAIIAANNTAGANVIGFNIPTTDPGFNGFVFTIRPNPDPLPSLDDDVTTIDGSSQSAFTGNTNETGPEIFLDGSLVDDPNNGNPGIWIVSGENRIHCLAVGNFPIGISLSGPFKGNNIITGCFVGVDPMGSQTRSNRSYGIGYVHSQFGGHIGGPTPDERNVISGNGNGIFISDAASDCVIENNFIGTDVMGQNAIPNGFGITVGDNCTAITVKNNLISGNQYGGIMLSSSSQISIEENMIGTDISGLMPLGNNIGLWAWSKVSYLTVANNLISANFAVGVWIGGGSDYAITGNIVGGDKNGNMFQNIPRCPLGIGLFWGGLPDDESVVRVTIGGSTERESNLVIGNIEGIGVNTTVDDILISRNRIRYNEAGINIYAKNNSKKFTAIRNEVSSNGTGIGVLGLGIGYAISENSIYSNNSWGIDLAANECCNDGVTPNDPGDIDIGPNNFMNFPVFTSAKATFGKLIVQGYLDTPNPETVTLEFFANPVPSPGGDPSGHGEGAIYLGSHWPNPQGKFTATLPTVAPGTLITATATDAEGNTSEFAANIVAKGPGN